MIQFRQKEDTWYGRPDFGKSCVRCGKREQREDSGFLLSFSRGVVAVLKIAPHPVFQVDRLAHVDDLAPLLHQVAARTVRQVFDFQLQGLIHTLLFDVVMPQMR